MGNGIYGQHGGRHVPKALKGALEQLELDYRQAMADEAFQVEFLSLLQNYVGRPSLLYFAKNMTDDLGGAKIYLKREDLNHTGSHKINNVLGQALLAKRIGRKRVIAETGAGQHGVATATAAALMGLACDVYMGNEDAERQALNVFRMEMLGARVHRIRNGTATLADAVDAALTAWAANPDESFYLLGSAVGPHPYPEMVRTFQSVIGRETREQVLALENRLPDCLIACVGGGSNAIGLFHDFIPDTSVQLIGIEPAGKGLETGQHAATIAKGEVGTFHGMRSYFLQTVDEHLAPVHSISAGLDYPGIGPEHAYLHDSQRAQYFSVTDAEAVDAFLYLSKIEGIIPAIESAHAIAYCRKIAPTLTKDQVIIVNLSGRGDKDAEMISSYLKKR